MQIRSRLCFELSKRLLPPPAVRTINYDAYGDWRNESLTTSWTHFSDAAIAGKDVLDFGCGDGQLSFFLAAHKRPRSIIGVDISDSAIERANATLNNSPLAQNANVKFKLGAVNTPAVDAQSVDTIVAFDCMEHVMEPEAIMRSWFAALRPGGRCLVEWSPYKGPWGPHMNSLVPIPWAHVVFGQKAMFETAEKIYDLPNFVPRHWDLDEAGGKKPNKWRQWSSFKEQGYINEIDIRNFERIAKAAGLRVARLEKHSFGGSGLRRGIGRALMSLPVIGEYFLSYAVVELVRPVV